ncbi:MAG: beta-1,3-glucanase family protein [Eubacterium sp.]
MAHVRQLSTKGKENGHLLLDNYINEFWNKYSNETLVFRCDAGTFRGRVSGDHMTFTKDGDGGTYTIYKTNKTTACVGEGKGNFNRGNSNGN